VKLKTFLFIASDLAAEQRTVVAHSASYGSGRPQISQAPAGAAEKRDQKDHFFRPIRGFDYFPNTFPRLSPWATLTRCSAASKFAHAWVNSRLNTKQPQG